VCLLLTASQLLATLLMFSAPALLVRPLLIGFASLLGSGLDWSQCIFMLLPTGIGEGSDMQSDGHAGDVCGSVYR